MFPGSRFQAFSGFKQKIAPGLFQEDVFKHFQAWSRKSFQKVSREQLSSIFRLGAENRSRKLPGSCFQQFSGLERKIGAGCFQEAVSKHFQVWSRKSLQHVPGRRFQAFSGLDQKLLQKTSRIEILQISSLGQTNAPEGAKNQFRRLHKIMTSHELSIL